MESDSSRPPFFKQLLIHGQCFLVYPAAFEPHPRDLAHPTFPYSDVEITTQDKVILRCYLMTPNNARATFIMFHGNGMDHSDFLFHARQFYNLNYNTLTVSYRGYGLSDGRPSERGLQRDAQAALDYIVNHPDTSLSGVPVIVYGLSLGGAVAIDVTARNPTKVSGMIIENTFTSIPDIIRGWPIINKFTFFCTQKWESASKLPSIPTSIPILFLCGLQDRIVPPKHMDDLWDIAKVRGKDKKGDGVVGGVMGSFKSICGLASCVGEKEKEGDNNEWIEPKGDRLIAFPAGGHVDTYTTSIHEYFAGIAEFADVCIEMKPQSS